MSRRCIVTNTGVQTGNNVSHANNKTRRRFLPNLNKMRFFSEVLGASYQLRVSAKGARTIEHKGGFDQFLLNTKPLKLCASLRKVRKLILQKKNAA